MHGNAIKLMLLTDMKIGETLALTWNDIDFKNGTITVNKTSSEINLSEDGKTDYSIKFKPLSDKRTRVITITPEIEAILLLLRKQKPYLTVRNFSKEWSSCVKFIYFESDEGMH